MSNAQQGEDAGGASNRPTPFSFGNLVGNLIQLAGSEPNPNVIADFMSTMMPGYNFTVTSRPTSSATQEDTAPMNPLYWLSTFDST